MVSGGYKVAVGGRRLGLGSTFEASPKLFFPPVSISDPGTSLERTLPQQGLRLQIVNFIFDFLDSYVRFTLVQFPEYN